jgi:hypothetical protein
MHLELSGPPPFKTRTRDLNLCDYVMCPLKKKKWFYSKFSVEIPRDVPYGNYTVK